MSVTSSGRSSISSRTKLDVGIIGVDALGDVLQQDRLAGARRGDDQAALAEADGGEDVDHARGDLGGVVLELDHRAGGRGRRLRRCGCARRIRWGEAFDGVEAREVAALGLALDEQARAEVELLDELSGDEDAARRVGGGVVAGSRN